MDKILILSDLHLGKKDKADNFTGEDKLMDLILKIEPDLIIFNGDIMELWQAKEEEIRKAYDSLFTFLDKYDKIWIKGNHDWDMKGFDSYSDYDFRFNGLKYHCEHGHRFDKTIPKNSWWIIRPIVWLYGWIERIFRIRPITPASKKYKGDFSEYKEGAKRLLAQGYDGVFFGHTHQREEIKFNYSEFIRIYGNSGCFVDGERDYILLENKLEM